MNTRLKNVALGAALAAFFAAGLAALALPFSGWWIDFGEQPVKSDVIVALAGDFARPFHAADLYAQGFAPEVWISRPRRPAGEARLDAIGVQLPREESVDRQILLKEGVPDAHIHLYGHDVLSTVDEARSLRREFLPQGMKILIVTSRYHARRSRMIFRRVFPDADVRVIAAPDENFTRKWWKSKELAQNTVLELFKTAYYLAGGAFLGRG